METVTQLESTIIDIITERLALPKSASIRADTPLFTSGGGLELDSLASLDILAGLSEKFGLAFDNIEAKDFRSVATLAEYVRDNGITDGDADR